MLQGTAGGTNWQPERKDSVSKEINHALLRSRSAHDIKHFSLLSADPSKDDWQY